MFSQLRNLVLAILTVSVIFPGLIYADSVEDGWAVAFENDILAGGSRDKDFTYGLSLTWYGDSSEKYLSPLYLQNHLDSFVGFNTEQEGKPGAASLEIGLYGFTPEDISQSETIEDDRPYASLVYVSSTRSRVNQHAQSVVSSSLSIGILGFDWVGDAQNSLHAALDGKKAQGWNRQISDGGELTAKYRIARQKYLPTRVSGFELKSTRQFSLGYISELSYSLGFRAGVVRSPWWTFDPEFTLYGEKPLPTTVNNRHKENYFWGGVSLKARFYNAFLQGQFRHSDHTYKSDELNPILLEAWAGYTFSFGDGFSLSYLLRAHSAEIKHGQGERNLVWGGLVVSRELI